MSTQALSISDLSLSYGSFRALNSVSLSIDAGNVFGLIGLNGAGKTSMIKAILGLRSVDEGRISIFGSEAMDQDTRLKFAYLPERFSPPSFLKGIEFLRFSAKLYGKRYEDSVYHENAEMLALDPDALNRYVQTYSKGMRQKLGILSTVLSGCDLLILDEPMSGLDPQARAYVKKILQDVQAQERTIFFSSHILADMAQICDQVAVLHDKRFLFQGTPAEMLKVTAENDLELAFLAMIDLDLKNAA